MLPQETAVEILEELLPAKNKSLFLARKLKIPDHTVEAIEKQYIDSQERLYHVIVEFVKQVEPRPTWRIITDALRSSIVNLPRLAKEIERRHDSHTPAIKPMISGSYVKCCVGVLCLHITCVWCGSIILLHVCIHYSSSIVAPSSVNISPTATAVVPYSVPDATGNS